MKEVFSENPAYMILALVGIGWIGLAAKREWNLEDIPALLSAMAFGFAMMFFSSLITFKIKSLNSNPVPNLDEMVGKIGRAYTTIPKAGEGIGQVEITFFTRHQGTRDVYNFK